MPKLRYTDLTANTHTVKLLQKRMAERALEEGKTANASLLLLVRKYIFKL